MTALSALRRRWRPVVLAYVYVELLYAVSNWRALRPDHLLPLTALDRAAPLLPWTAWIYVTVYFMPLLTCALTPRDEDIPGMIGTFLAMDTLCTLVFVAYPTAYPRPLAGAGWSLLALVQRLDTPRNCSPSQHVANAVLAALFLRPGERREGSWALAWAAAISLSTLTTKQHYAWDVAAGALSAAAAWALHSWGRKTRAERGIFPVASTARVS